MSDIFISYASDNRPRAEQIAAIMEAQGWSVWWDREIPLGRTFDEVIEEALTAARVVVVLWSEKSVASDWVRAEAEEGAKRRILVPALIEEVSMPLRFRNTQAANLTKWGGEREDPELRKLLDAISNLLGDPAAPAPTTEQRAPEATRTDATLTLSAPVAAAPSDPKELRKIGPYPVVRFIAEGGMAWVYEVEDVDSHGRHLALKMMKPEIGSDEKVRRRFVREQQLLSKIEHPYLVTLFTSGVDEPTGCLWYTMQLVTGKTLAELVAGGDGDGDGEPLDLEAVGKIFLPLLEALGTLHDEDPPVVHRDIKPSNIMRTAKGHPLLTDLGIARELGGAKDVTWTTGFVGSVLYASPEQARARTVTPRSDIFSMGLTLYFALAGKSAYEDVDGISTTNEDVLGYLVGLDQGGRSFAFKFPTEIRDPLRRVIQKACATVQGDRYSDAGAMRTALDQALRESEALPPPGQRGQILKYAVGAVAGVALLAVLYLAAPAAIEMFSPGADGGGELAVELTPEPTVEETPKPPEPIEVAAIREPEAIVEPPPPAPPPAAPSLPPGLVRIAPPAGLVLGSTPAEITAALELCARFQPGCEREWYASEAQRSVSLGSFLIDAHEVTNAEFGAFVAASGHRTSAERVGQSYLYVVGLAVPMAGVTWRSAAGENSPQHPVVHVSASDAEAYCAWAQGRLPSEDEWEFSARGPERSTFPWSNDWQPDRVHWQTGERSGPEPVETANGTSPTGVHDLIGNVWEWTASSVGSSRVLKGGSWNETNPANLRAAVQRFEDPEASSSEDGFRCVYDAVPAR